MRWTLAAVLLAQLLGWRAGPSGPGLQPTSDQQATFKSGVDLVAVDVSIVDKNGRPVDDLKLDEFTLKVDGKTRKLTSAEFINLRRTDDRTDPEPTTYSTNQGAKPGRLILIVVDEGNIHKGNGRNIMAAAARFIDGLNKSDRISLEFIPGTGPMVGFTANHALVKKLLENGVGKMVEADFSKRVGMVEAMQFVREGNRTQQWMEVLDRECISLAADPVNGYEACKGQVENEARTIFQMARAQTTSSLLSLRAIIQRLKGSTAPKSVVLITEGVVIERNVTDISWVGPMTSESQVNLYSLQIDGSFTDASVRGQSPTHYEDHDLFVEGLNRLTGEARGIVLPIAVNANAVFSRLDLELSGYYLLSFEPDLVDRDGKAHDISVKVSRPGTDIRSRAQFKVAAPASAKSTDELVVDALKNPLPLSDMGVKVTTFTYKDDATPKLKVLITTELDRSLNPSGDFSLGYLVTDPRGNLVSSQFERGLSLPSKDDTGRPQRYTGAIVVTPGIYTLKLAVVDPTGRTGSVERTFEAKLTSAGQLKFGELMLAEVVGRNARPSVDGRITADTLMAYAEVYSDANGPLQSATAKIEIGKTETDLPNEVASLQFSDRKYDGKRTAEGSVPIALLAEGDYVARAVFVIDGKKIGQVTRPFTVTHSNVARPALRPVVAGAPTTSATSAPVAPIAFTSKIESFDRESVMSPRVVSFFVDHMNIVGLPQMPAALSNAIIAAKAGRFVELQQEVATAPAHPASSFLHGIARMAQNDTEGAETSFKAALKAAPEFFPAAFYLGASRAATGRDADAVAIWQTALITEADAPFVYTLLGDAMLRLHKTADAIGLLREAALLWPDSDDVTMRFGTALAQGGQAADALKVLDPYLTRHATDQDRLMLAMRLIYEAKSAGHSVESADSDRARFNRYFAAYEKTGGAQLATAAEWKKFVEK